MWRDMEGVDTQNNIEFVTILIFLCAFFLVWSHGFFIKNVKCTFRSIPFMV